MSKLTQQSVIMPRNFKLLEEYDEMKECNIQNISYGPEKEDDITLTDWNGLIVDNNGTFSNVRITCGQKYPVEAPIVVLTSSENNKIKALFDSTKHIRRDLPFIKNWNHNMGIKDILIGLQKMG